MSELNIQFVIADGTIQIKDKSQNKYFLEKIRDLDKMQYTNTYTYENIFE